MSQELPSTRPTVDVSDLYCSVGIGSGVGVGVGITIRQGRRPDRAAEMFNAGK